MTTRHRKHAPTRLAAMRLAQSPNPWTQERLVHELMRAAQHTGAPVRSRASLKVQVSRWENGHVVPDAKNRVLLRLVFRTTDEELGFSDYPRGGTMEIEPVPFQADWITSFDQAASQWSLDMQRRQFLKGSAYAAAASTGPALQWFLGRPETIVRENGTVLVGRPHIESIRAMTKTFRSLDNRFGGGHARDSVIRYLATEVAPLIRDGRFSSTIGPQLLSAAAETTQLAGWMTYDAGMHALGQRYMAQALRLALAADDASLGGEILAGLSHQASYLHDAPTAIDLARAAGKTARERGLEALEAEAAVMEAHGYACAKDERACAQALSVAETALDRADRSADPHWIGYFDEAYLSAKFGHCFKELRQAETAERFARRSLDMDNSYVRGRAFNLVLLATAHAQAGDVEQACCVGDEAVSLVQELQSVRANEYVRSLQRELEGYRSAPAVEVFNRSVSQALPQAV
jgi:hypothetical protein